jgi:hypothetical protein
LGRPTPTLFFPRLLPSSLWSVRAIFAFVTVRFLSFGGACDSSSETYLILFSKSNFGFDLLLLSVVFCCFFSLSLWDSVFVSSFLCFFLSSVSLFFAEMSLRPNARVEVRKKGYKLAVDADEARRKREDNMVEIRKNKRDESLLKKRREGLQQPQQQLFSSSTQAVDMEKKVKLDPASRNVQQLLVSLLQ